MRHRRTLLSRGNQTLAILAPLAVCSAVCSGIAGRSAFAQSAIPISPEIRHAAPADSGQTITRDPDLRRSSLKAAPSRGNVPVDTAPQGSPAQLPATPQGNPVLPAADATPQSNPASLGTNATPHGNPAPPAADATPQTVRVSPTADATPQTEAASPSADTTQQTIPMPPAIFLSLLDGEQVELLTEWETRLRADEHTTKLETIEPGRYRFQTTRFPYDGELRVLNVAIEDMPGWNGATSRMGVVEVELPDLDPQFFERHGQSYGFWAQSNLLYHDGKQWLSTKEWTEKVQSDASSYCGTGTTWAWLGILAGLIVLTIFALRRANRQMKRSLMAQNEALAQQRVAIEQQRIAVERQVRSIQLTERSLELSERQTRILNEILDELRKSA